MKKTISSSILVLLLSISGLLAGCGDDAQEPDASPPERDACMPADAGSDTDGGEPVTIQC